MFKLRAGKEGSFVKHRLQFSDKTRFSNCLGKATVDNIRRYIENSGWPSHFQDEFCSHAADQKSIFASDE